MRNVQGMYSVYIRRRIIMRPQTLYKRSHRWLTLSKHVFFAAWSSCVRSFSIAVNQYEIAALLRLLRTWVYSLKTIKEIVLERCLDVQKGIFGSPRTGSNQALSPPVAIEIQLDDHTLLRIKRDLERTPSRFLRRIILEVLKRNF